MTGEDPQAEELASCDGFHVLYHFVCDAICPGFLLLLSFLETAYSFIVVKADIIDGSGFCCLSFSFTSLRTSRIGTGNDYCALLLAEVHQDICCHFPGAMLAILLKYCCAVSGFCIFVQEFCQVPYLANVLLHEGTDGRFMLALLGLHLLLLIEGIVEAVVSLDISRRWTQLAVRLSLLCVSASLLLLCRSPLRGLIFFTSVRMSTLCWFGLSWQNTSWLLTKNVMGFLDADAVYTVLSEDVLKFRQLAPHTVCVPLSLY